MSLRDELGRMVSGANAQKTQQDIERKRSKQAREAELRDDEWKKGWANARRCAEQAEETAKAAAQCGQREATVYFAKSNRYTGFSVTRTDNQYAWRWGNPHTDSHSPIPEYAQFVFDHCQRLGLQPRWVYRIYRPSSTFPNALELVVHW